MPTEILTDSSSGYANEPILNILRKPLHKMSQDELRVHTNELRTLRLSPQSLGKIMRASSEAKETKEENRVARAQAPKKSLEDLMKEMEGL